MSQIRKGKEEVRRLNPYALGQGDKAKNWERGLTKGKEMSRLPTMEIDSTDASGRANEWRKIAHLFLVG